METELQQRNLIRRIWSHVSSYFQFSAPNVNESSRSGAHAGRKQWYRYSGFQKKARREIVQRFSAAQQSAVFASLAAKVFFCFLSILLVCQNHVSLLPGMSTKCVLSNPFFNGIVWQYVTNDRLHFLLSWLYMLCNACVLAVTNSWSENGRICKYRIIVTRLVPVFPVSSATQPSQVRYQWLC